jgi:hypothetical protein
MRELASRLDEASALLGPHRRLGFGGPLQADDLAGHPELADDARRLRALRSWCDTWAADLRRRAAIAEQADLVSLDPHAATDVRAAFGLAASGAADAALVTFDLLMAGHPDAGAVAAFFAALPYETGLAVALTRAAVAGPLGGVPFALRYEANRALIRVAFVHETDRRRRALFASLLRGPRQFLLFDPSGQGRIAEVLGDLAGATSVAFMVPGTYSNLMTYESGPAGDARTLHDFVTRFSGGHAATVMWMGCDLPQFILPDAALQSYAENGGPMLRDFVNGLRLGPGVRTTLIGHSYGSTVTGHAVQAGLKPVNLVAVASPGWGVNSVEDLHAPKTHLYVLRHPHDVISVAPVIGLVSKTGLAGWLASPWLGHGLDPAFLSGTTRLATGTDQARAPIGLDIGAHTTYFTHTGRATLATINIAHVVAGDVAPLTFAEARGNR